MPMTSNIAAPIQKGGKNKQRNPIIKQPFEMYLVFLKFFVSTEMFSFTSDRTLLNSSSPTSCFNVIFKRHLFRLNIKCLSALYNETLKT